MAPSSRQHLRPNQQRSGVFISYARSDGSEFAHRLRQQLERRNITLWQDRVAMEGGRNWWLQITEALDNVSFLLLVVTPNALKSDIVRKEWRYARQQGVCVYPIKGSPEVDYNSMPRWMRDAAFYDLGTLADSDISPEWPKFLNDLNKTPEVRRVPLMVEDLPANFVHRSREFDQLIALLLDRTREEPVAITAALRGAGGYGKTTIAKSLCHDQRVQDAFDDGILWVTMGETPGDLTGRVEDLIQTLSGERPGFTSLEAAIARFTELLEDRDILLVIDDVWNRDHLRPFLQGGHRCARLITTRNLDTLPAQAQPVKVDAMQSAEAVQALRAGLPAAGQNACEEELRKLAERLGEWPLLLGLAGGALQDRVINTNQPLPDAIVYVNRALDKRGLTFFDAHNAEARNQAVAKTLGVSLGLLRPAELARYHELAVFPEDVNIPLTTLEKFWGKMGEADGFDAEFDTQELCARLNRLSLLLNFDTTARHIRLHGVVRQYLMSEQGDRLAGLHDNLLDSHLPPPCRESLLPRWDTLPEDEPYLWDHLGFHLIEAKRGEELVETVKDWRYLAKKTLLRKSHAVENDLLKAQEIAPADDPLQTLRRGISGSAHLFNHCENRPEIESTLFARLQHLSALKAGLLELAHYLDRPHIEPCGNINLPDLPHPALVRTLEGHTNYVRGCAFSPDGKLIVSASDDRTLKLWDARTGEILRSLKGHSASARGCAFSPDGKLIVSASDDCTLKLWDAHTGRMLRSLEGHSDYVRGCAFSPDGWLIASASDDCTLKLWDARNGETLCTLEGHSDYVRGCAFSPDGKLIVSASDDCTLKLWDAQTGELIRSLKGHSASARGCAFSADGKWIASASADRTLKLWDARNGEALCTLEGHSDYVRGCAFSPDGKLIVSASDDCTLKLWDARTGQMLRSLDDHSDHVWGCAFSTDGKLIASASDDRTLKLWDAQTGEILRSIEGHSDWVWSCAFSPDGRLIVSASDDCTLKLWDARTGQMLRTFEGHPDYVLGCAFSPDGRLIVSASDDCTLKLWDARTGQMLRSLEGHSDSVWSCAFSTDGKLIASASDDRTLKLWDAQTGELLRSLKGHSDHVRDCAFSADGKLIASASADRTLKLWDARTGQMLRTFEGHPDYVLGCAFSPDGKLIVSASADRTLRVWDSRTSEILHTIEGHTDYVKACAFSPDGKLIVSASSDRILKIWDVDTGKCLASFFADGPMLGCTISGEMIAAAGARGVYFLRLVQ